MTANGCCAIKGETKCWKGKSNPPAPTAKATTTTTTKAVATTKGGSCPSGKIYAYVGVLVANKYNEACHWWCHKAGFKCRPCEGLKYCSTEKRGKVQHCCVGGDKCKCIEDPKITFDTTYLSQVESLMFVPHFKENRVCTTQCNKLALDCRELKNDGFFCCKARGKAFKGPDDCRKLPMDENIKGWSKVNNKCKQTCEALTKNGNNFHCLGRFLIVFVCSINPASIMSVKSAVVGLSRVKLFLQTTKSRPDDHGWLLCCWGCTHQS